ncbi:hypothetical protein [Ruminococcus sp. YE282]|uniref:hypothetical protein n=1 Tax=Ruminococcus sp. YE282 TaxID=3158780 RepID=UPI00088DD3C7|nr:hypothetical protein SAMN02910441_01168 [Ruminococcus bromii]
MNYDDELTMFEALLYAQEGESPSKAIENQEKRGQQSVVANQRLPKRTNFCSGYQNKNNTDFTKSQYEKMGIEIVGDYDGLFWEVQLPEGWQVKATSHSMWNEIIDNKGRKRATFFYKAAFYDRDAFVNFETRFNISVEHTADYTADYDVWSKSDYHGVVKDCDKIIFETETRPYCEDLFEEDKKVIKPLTKVLEKYMAEHYPDYKDVNAYWD